MNDSPQPLFCRTPFARIFLETRTPHRFECGKAWNNVPWCARCGGFEGSLLSTCPIQPLTLAETEIVYSVFCEKTRVWRDEAAQHRQMGVQFSGLTEPTIAEYNEAARRFNDNLIDLTVRQREVEKKGLTSAGSSEKVTAQTDSSR